MGWGRHNCRTVAIHEGLEGLPPLCSTPSHTLGLISVTDMDVYDQQSEQLTV